jgi:predicted nuclease of predicted toxin-antitoxin system
MRFKLDENLPLEIGDAFRNAGHEIDSVQSEGLTGATDFKIREQVQIENQILLIMDKGIADIRPFPPSQYPGIVLFRPASSGRGEVLRFVQGALPGILSIDIAGHLVIVSPRGIRTR